MPDLPSAPRRYSDDEVAHLLKRATELQADNRPAVRGSGLTLPELEEIAAEAGIDVETLRQAADELEVGRQGSRAGRAFFGAPLQIVRARTLPFEADSTRFDQLLAVIQTSLGGSGHAIQIGRTFSWSDEDTRTTRSTVVTVSVGSGRTTVRVQERYNRLAGALFGGVLGGVGGGVGLGPIAALLAVFGATPLVFAWPVGVIGMTYTACRAGFRARVRGRERLLARLLDDLAAALTPDRLAGAQGASATPLPRATDPG